MYIILNTMHVNQRKKEAAHEGGTKTARMVKWGAQLEAAGEEATLQTEVCIYAPPTFAK